MEIMYFKTFQSNATMGLFICNEDSLKNEYRRLAQKLHPDKGGNAEQFIAMMNEYEYILSNFEWFQFKINNTGDSKAWLDKGVVLYQQGHYEEAMDAFKQAISINHNYASAYYNLGMVYGSLGRYQEEIEAYKLAINIKPNFVEANCRLNIAYAQLRHYQKSVDASKRTIICDVCRLNISTSYVKLYQNIGAFFVRYYKSIDGDLCMSCINKYFWRYTLTTLTLGWWGAISFCVTPVFILINFYYYFHSWLCFVRHKVYHDRKKAKTAK
jgi:tetratricopeptide (TPR) repeat protein